MWNVIRRVRSKLSFGESYRKEAQLCPKEKCRSLYQLLSRIIK